RRLAGLNLRVSVRALALTELSLQGFAFNFIPQAGQFVIRNSLAIFGNLDLVLMLNRAAVGRPPDPHRNRATRTPSPFSRSTRLLSVTSSQAVDDPQRRRTSSRRLGSFAEPGENSATTREPPGLSDPPRSRGPSNSSETLR